MCFYSFFTLANSKTKISMRRSILIVSAIALIAVFTSSKIKTTTMQQQDDKPTIYYVLFHSPGAKWVNNLSFQQQPGVMDHVNYMASFLETKRLVEGGPFLDNSGGMMVFVELKKKPKRLPMLTLL
jgi:hypothetical protein